MLVYDVPATGILADALPYDVFYAFDSAGLVARNAPKLLDILSVTFITDLVRRAFRRWTF